jgi:histidinol-phosphate aminotransferase
VREALKDYIDQSRIQMYPEYDRFLSKLSTYANVHTDQVMLSNGSDQGIEILLRAFLESGDTMVIARPEFPIFTQVAGVLNAKIREVSFGTDMAFPFDRFQNAVTKDVSLIVIINPNNPTGTPMELSQIETILANNPDIPVIVDEAYYEYTGITTLGFLEKYPNLIITRTFSKAFAMAGLRLGYVIAHPEIITQMYKIRGPFDVNSCALVAAEVQIDHPEIWMSYIREVMDISKPFLENFFMENDITFFPGAAHFMLVKPPDRDRAVEYLKHHQILVRPMVASLISDTFRMNVGTFEQTRVFAEVYKNYLQETL